MLNNTILLSEMLMYFHGNKERHIKGKELANKLLITPLEVRLLVRELRNNGHPIIATCGGYIFTENNDAINRYVEKRMLEIRSEYYNLKKLGTYTDSVLDLQWGNDAK